MKTLSTGKYDIAAREVIAAGADMRVQVLTLEPGQFVPWHKHSEISDHMVCLKGTIIVETREPDAVHTLNPGERVSVEPTIAHTVYGSDTETSEFLLIQGVGVYDYVEV